MAIQKNIEIAILRCRRKVGHFESLKIHTHHIIQTPLQLIHVIRISQLHHFSMSINMYEIGFRSMGNTQYPVRFSLSLMHWIMNISKFER